MVVILVAYLVKTHRKDLLPDVWLGWRWLRPCLSGSVRCSRTARAGSPSRRRRPSAARCHHRRRPRHLDGVLDGPDREEHARRVARPGGPPYRRWWQGSRGGGLLRPGWFDVGSVGVPGGRGPAMTRASAVPDATAVPPWSTAPSRTPVDRRRSLDRDQWPWCHPQLRVRRPRTPDEHQLLRRHRRNDLHVQR